MEINRQGRQVFVLAESPVILRLVLSYTLSAAEGGNKGLSKGEIIEAGVCRCMTDVKRIGGNDPGFPPLSPAMAMEAIRC